MIPIIGEVWNVNGKKTVIVSLHGSLASDDEKRLRSALQSALGQNPDLIVVDFTKCPTIAEEPKRALLGVYKQISRKGIIAFAGAGEAIRTSMKPTKLEALFTIHRTTLDALAAFAPPIVLDQ
ncbi:MAG: STAS domain-containing protein [Candidatus Peregrinibacteria bacterium]